MKSLSWIGRAAYTGLRMHTNWKDLPVGRVGEA